MCLDSSKDFRLTWIIFSSQIAEFTKECSEQWRAMDSKAKKKYDDKAAADKERYEAEVDKMASVF